MSPNSLSPTSLYALAAWCYVLAIVMALWLIPHAMEKCSLMLKAAVLMYAAGLLYRGAEFWRIADRLEYPPEWLVVNALAPLAATCVLAHFVWKSIAVMRRKREKRVVCRTSHQS